VRVQQTFQKTPLPPTISAGLTDFVSLGEKRNHDVFRTIRVAGTSRRNGFHVGVQPAPQIGVRRGTSTGVRAFDRVKRWKFNTKGSKQTANENRFRKR